MLLLLLIGVGLAIVAFLFLKRHSKNDPILLAEYDFIVVGAGNSGAVVASRLAEANFSVLVLEGGDHDSSGLYVPLSSHANRGGEHDWCFKSVPQTAMNSRIINQPRGKGLGGCTLLNQMICVRGDPADYDAWANEYKCSGWSWSNLLPFFMRIETYQGIPSPGRGVSGPIRISEAQTAQSEAVRTW